MQNAKESQPPSKMACLPQPIVRTSKADHCLRCLSSILVQRAHTGINKSELKSQRYFSFTTGDMWACSLASEPLCGHLGSRQESPVHRTGLLEKCPAQGWAPLALRHAHPIPHLPDPWTSRVSQVLGGLDSVPGEQSRPKGRGLPSHLELQLKDFMVW